uniref:Uroporphyrinogen decarboxylase n=1 Tax=Florenciella parvula TaxID=236787 RepID=A0A7S2GCU9_9STRA
MSATAAEAEAATAAGSSEKDPLLLRAARGEKVERSPVWMMRQAGRHMQVYRDLCAKYPTFRERSEIPEVSLEISLQPWRAYKTDGVILFSDILTPLPGMNVEFDIDERRGPVVEPYRTQERVDTMTKMDPEEACPFVGSVLRDLRKEVGNEATVLGFVGLPYTLATYLVEGQTSREYLEIKKMGLSDPKLLHQMLQTLCDNIGEYACYQIDNGAQVIQVFDSWAGHLSPRDYDEFALPYQKQVIAKIKSKHPDVPVIIYIKQSGALLERMAQSGADIVSVDWTVSMDEAMRRLGPNIGVQGNLDPAVLMGPHDQIKERTEEILKMTGGKNHVMNLGHGIEAKTPEPNAKCFVDTVKNFKHQ